ncbi:MAG: choice-of-anchor L domain-containing protein, partial [Psychroflexus sp.]
MRRIFLLLVFLSATLANAQYVTTDHTIYSPEGLVEDILFSTTCVEDLNISETVSGNFEDGMLSYGFFESNNSGFPFESGIVLSTGRLNNVDGPNNNLSDDNAPGWGGDNDLENALQIGGTTNATIMRFTFTPKAENVSFRYIFASEEYQEGDPNTCQYSDAFAFLIRPVGGQYQNIAVIPGTNEPVLVTSVHPEIPGGCEAQNEEYFGQFNGNNAAINFNGQTDILTAEAQVIPEQTYEIKLVIADEQNYRYDSAVFLEADSFNIGVDLGDDRTGSNSLCEGETYEINLPNNLNSNPVTWFHNGNPISGENDLNYTISEANFGAGTYRVEVDLGGGCIADDEIEVEYASATEVGNLGLTQCFSEEGELIFNLNNISQDLNNQGFSLGFNGFFNTLTEAENDQNAINNPDNYTGMAGESVFVRLQNQSGCISISEINLGVETNYYEQVEIFTCVSEPDEFAVYSIFQSINFIKSELNFEEENVNLFETEIDAANGNNTVTGTNLEIDISGLPKTYFARISEPGECLGIAPVVFDIKDQVELPEEFETLYLCESESSVSLNAGLNNTSLYNFTWNTGETTSSITIDEPGEYEVIVDLAEAPSDNCSAIKTFEVLPSSIADITFEINGAPGSYVVEIFAEGSGNYVYAINNSGFQDSNVLTVNSPVNTIYVQDLNGCGTVSEEFTVVDFPDFFTPNQDGINDYWRPVGLNLSDPIIETVHIFDRFGKKLHQIGTLSQGWDGNYN